MKANGAIREDLIRLQNSINECLDDLAIARDRKDDGEELIALRRMEALLGDVKQTCSSVLNSMQEEPVSGRFTFKAIPRLLEMIEPTDRAKTYTTKLADTLEVEGYSTDAKIVRERLKIMNGEKVSMATMDEGPVSDELKEFEREYIEREKDNIVCVYDRHAGLVDGAKWQKEYMMKDATEAYIRRNRYTKQNVLNGFDVTCDAIQKFNSGDKVKVLILK